MGNWGMEQENDGNAGNQSGMWGIRVGMQGIGLGMQEIWGGNIERDKNKRK